jgi:flavoprotein
MDDDVKRELDDLRQGRTNVARVFTLAVAPATATSVACISMSSNSVVLTQAYAFSASNADITRIVPSKDFFIVTHPASAATSRTFRYVWLTGIVT